MDATQLDSKQHWQTVQSTPPSTATSDYTIAKNDSGIMTIDEARVVTYAGARPLTTTVNSTIGYDYRTIPVSVHEYSIERREHAEQYQTVTSETVLQLRSDSLAVKTP